MKSRLKIPYVNLPAQLKKEEKTIFGLLRKNFYSGQFVGGDEIDKFEKNVLKFTGTKYAVALNSGTDALTFALSLCDVRKGDEVITVPNSFIASTGCIIHLGAKPVFVDVLSDQNIDTKKIEEKITSKTKVIMPVHLTGRVARMDEIIKIAKKYNIKVVEDAAQSIGSKFKNKFSGSFGDIGCFSTHPLKNLNALGDGGFLTTNNRKIYERVKLLRNHGLENRNNAKYFGYVSRMDTIQAAILNFRLKNLEKVIEKRRANASFYFKNLKNKNLILPFEKHYEFNTYHTFVVQCRQRNNLQKYLLKNGIETGIHYPIPIHLQDASSFLKYKKGDFPMTENQSKQILTLPIHQFLKKTELKYIINQINKFYD
tara:strand:+ start:7744 stop:8853 length:1110 start_codon:yes stop_codon:yes gene_type:complete